MYAVILYAHNLKGVYIMTIYEKGQSLTEEEKFFFTAVNKGTGLIPTGETIKKTYSTGIETKAVFKGKWTPYGYIRDCGKYYIEARYSEYVKISKDLKTITRDVDDK